MYHRSLTHRYGFTLVELSIVLVILGLLVGGILVGQALIHAAEIRSISSSFDKYQQSINAFRDKYMAIPGDMAMATKFWGAQDGSTGLTAGCFTTASTSQLTCNGDGDRTILAGAGTDYHESYRAWQHLANAGLIEGTFNGIRSTTPLGGVPGTNSPAGKIANSGFGLFYADSGSYGLYGSDRPGNKLSFGANSGDVMRAAVIRGEDAASIDEKMDDGIPGEGKITTDPSSLATCYNASAYDYTSTVISCGLRLSI